MFAGWGKRFERTCNFAKSSLRFMLPWGPPPYKYKKNLMNLVVLFQISTYHVYLSQNLHIQFEHLSGDLHIPYVQIRSTFSKYAIRRLEAAKIK